MTSEYIGEFNDDTPFDFTIFSKAIPNVIAFVNVQDFKEYELTSEYIKKIPMDIDDDGKPDLKFETLDVEKPWTHRMMRKGESVGLFRRYGFANKDGKYDIVVRAGPPFTEEEMIHIVKNWVKNSTEHTIYHWSESLEYKMLVSFTVRNALRIAYDFAVKMRLSIEMEKDTMSFHNKTTPCPMMAKPAKIEFTTHLDYGMKKEEKDAKVLQFKEFVPFATKNKIQEESTRNPEFHVFYDPQAKMYHCIKFKPKIENFIGLPVCYDNKKTDKIPDITINESFDCFPVIGKAFQGSYIKDFLQ